MFITAVSVIFLIKLRWPKNKSLLVLHLQLQNKRITELGFRMIAKLSRQLPA